MKGTGAPISLELGQLGANVIEDTAEYTGDWGVIQALTDVAFTKLTSSTMRSADDTAVYPAASWSGKNLFGGDRLFGRFSTIQLASGVAICYKI